MGQHTGIPFFPETLAADFGPASPRTRRCLRAIRDRLDAGGDAELRALQGYYALLVRALVAALVPGVRGLDAGLPLPEAPEEAAAEVRARLREYDAAQVPAGGQDLLKALYEQLVPSTARRAQGEFYTPDWLAEQLLGQLGFPGEGQRLLDPACGSGTFLVLAIRRLRAAHERSPLPRAELRRRILHRVAGIDRNPLAVLAARANFLIAIRDLLDPAEPAAELALPVPVPVPVYWGDSIAGDVPLAPVEVIAGNPPWLLWDRLPAAERAATRERWQRYGLFSLSGNAARHGGGKKDLAMLMLYACADRYLLDGGRLGFVVPQALFQSKGAGDGFRRFRLGAQGAPLGVLRVDDFGGRRVFAGAGASAGAATLVVEKGRPTQYPVPYYRWPGPRALCAEPIDDGKPGAPWLLRPAEVDLRALVAPSDYRAHAGAYSGGQNGVYWVRVLGGAPGGVRVRNLAGNGVAEIERVLEPDLLYPLLRWGDVARFRALAGYGYGYGLCLLLVQDVAARAGIPEALLRERWPRTHAYLHEFRDALLARAAYRRYQAGTPFYSMYDVGAYTLAPIKVVWRRMDKRLTAAVVRERAVSALGLGLRPVVPQETCALVAAGSVEEAHYLAALLNSSVVDALVRAHSVRGGRGFGTPSMLEYLGLRRYRPADPQHRALAALAEEAATHGLRADLQDRIDQAAARLYGLAPAALDTLLRALE